MFGVGGGSAWFNNALNGVRTNAGHTQAGPICLPLVHALVQLSDLGADHLVRSSRHGLRHDGHGHHVVPGAGVVGNVPPCWAQFPVFSVAMAGRPFHCGSIFHSARVRGDRLRGGVDAAVGRLELGVGRTGHAASRVARHVHGAGRGAGAGSWCLN